MMLPGNGWRLLPCASPVSGSKICTNWPAELKLCEKSPCFSRAVGKRCGALRVVLEP
jgi:hypothetical protein